MPKQFGVAVQPGPTVDNGLVKHPGIPKNLGLPQDLREPRYPSVAVDGGVFRHDGIVKHPGMPVDFPLVEDPAAIVKVGFMLNPSAKIALFYPDIVKVAGCADAVEGHTVKALSFPGEFKMLAHQCVPARTPAHA